MPRLLWFALLFSLITLDQTDGWIRRRQRRRCLRVDCAVTWRSWSSCSLSCGGGTQYRHGSITRQPACGGSLCPALKQYQSCNSHKCPVPGGWSSWAAWGSCSRSCGTGNQNRHRSCTAPVPKYGGRSCSGVSRQFKSCYRRHCPDGVGCYAKFPHSILLGGFKSEIQWFGRPLPNQMEKVIKKCAGVAAKKGMKYYALEDFGNCYGARTFSAYSQTKAACCFFGIGLKNVYFVYKT
ncbi:coadhesin-like [Acropora millepora]|nr:coadhesin-like [Acropora millepora]XP_044164643.1 coadhesin-like [Acropora millepora]